MPSFSNRIAAIRELAAELDTFAARVGEVMNAAQRDVETVSDRILGNIESMVTTANPRLEDFKRQLEDETAAGNNWAKGLLDLVHQVEQGTLRADQAFHKFGNGLVLFEGQLVHVDTLLTKFLPTTGQVQERLQELAEALKGADIRTLVDRLNEQYNEYALALARAVELYKAGKGSLERIALLAQQIQDRLPGSETDVLAQEIRDQLLGGLI
jgi:hypothetical protein